MGENLFAPKQKAVSNKYRKNWSKIFGGKDNGTSGTTGKENTNAGEQDKRDVKGTRKGISSEIL